MSVKPIGHLDFTRADIHVLLNRGGELVDRGLAGACVPVETEAGELVIALLDYDHQCLICAIGKSQGWYYALDAAWQPCRAADPPVSAFLITAKTRGGPAMPSPPSAGAGG